MMVYDLSTNAESVLDFKAFRMGIEWLARALLSIELLTVVRCNKADILIV